MFDTLKEKLDAQSVARYMFQCNSLTLKDLQSIQSKRKKSVRAAEQLLNIVMSQSSHVFGCFMSALKQKDQQHLYEKVIAGSYKGNVTRFVFTIYITKESTLKHMR